MKANWKLQLTKSISQVVHSEQPLTNLWYDSIIEIINEYMIVIHAAYFVNGNNNKLN